METPVSLDDVGGNEPHEVSTGRDADREQAVAELLDFSFEPVEQSQDDSDLEAGCLSCS